LVDRTTLARERFFERGDLPSGLVTDAVLRSWQRSLQGGHRPQDRPVFAPVSRSRARAAVERSHALIEASGPELDQLEHALAATGCRILLTDARGVVIHASRGDAEPGGVMEAACRVGVDLSEARVGSNAPGIVATCGDASTVLGAEHFYGALRQCHCAAAPIRGRRGELIGVLDLSIEGRPFGFDALTQAKLSAAAIENRWMAHRPDGHLLLRFHSDRRLLRTPLEALALIDGCGRLVSLNGVGRALTGLTQPAHELHQGLVDAESALGLPRRAWETAATIVDPVVHGLPSGLQVWMDIEGCRSPVRTPRMPVATQSPQQAHALHTLPGGTNQLIRPMSTGCSVSEREIPEPLGPLRDWSRRAIQAALARHGGNLSAAARTLGVSRGLLYRRLREMGG
jgi:transcriptional regulator of acetoin/glycerol metabolism